MSWGDVLPAPSFTCLTAPHGQGHQFSSAEGQGTALSAPPKGRGHDHGAALRAETRNPRASGAGLAVSCANEADSRGKEIYTKTKAKNSQAVWIRQASIGECCYFDLSGCIKGRNILKNTKSLNKMIKAK